MLIDPLQWCAINDELVNVIRHHEMHRIGDSQRERAGVAGDCVVTMQGDGVVVMIEK